MGVSLTATLNKTCLYQHTHGPRRPRCSPWCGHGCIQNLAGTSLGRPSMGKTKKNPSQPDLGGVMGCRYPVSVQTRCPLGQSRLCQRNCCLHGALKGPENLDTVKSCLNFSFIFQPRRDGSPLDKLRAQPGTRNGFCAFAG